MSWHLRDTQSSHALNYSYIWRLQFKLVIFKNVLIKREISCGHQTGLYLLYFKHEILEELTHF